MSSAHRELSGRLGEFGATIGRLRTSFRCPYRQEARAGAESEEEVALLAAETVLGLVTG